jgi:hypothetical protein
MDNLTFSPEEDFREDTYCFYVLYCTQLEGIGNYNISPIYMRFDKISKITFDYPDKLLFPNILHIGSSQACFDAYHRIIGFQNKIHEVPQWVSTF